MRPAPPEPNTPNEGRQKPYEPLVEPHDPIKRSRRENITVATTAGVVVGGVIVVAQVVIGLLS